MGVIRRMFQREIVRETVVVLDDTWEIVDLDDEPAWSAEMLEAAINACGNAASNAVYEYAAKFPNKKDYEPLERLAYDVHRISIKAACRVLNEVRENKAVKVAT